MEILIKSTLLAGAAAAALTLVAGPALALDEADPGIVLAAEDQLDDALVDDDDAAPPAEAGDGRIQVAETPRDQLGLLILGALVAGGGLAVVNARRQLKGERPQASGEFRWR